MLFLPTQRSDLIWISQKKRYLNDKIPQQDNHNQFSSSVQGILTSENYLAKPYIRTGNTVTDRIFAQQA